MCDQRRASGALGAPRARARGPRERDRGGRDILYLILLLTRPAAATGRPGRVCENMVKESDLIYNIKTH